LNTVDIYFEIRPFYSAELLTDFSYTNFTVSYRDALDRLRVHLNIILLNQKLQTCPWDGFQSTQAT